MFDAKRLLGQLVASQMGGSHGRHGHGHGGYSGHGSSPIDSLARQFGGSGGSGALVGGLASALLGSKKGRKLGGSTAKLGGLALVGSLAYRAYQNWQAGQASAGSSSGRASFLPPSGSHPFGGSGGPDGGFGPAPEGTRFNPTSETEQQNLSLAILRAMIAAAKADGHIDQTEQANIFAALDKLDLDTEGKAFVMDELRAPLDIDAVARGARGPEEAAEIYAASLLAIDVDNAAERGYLAMLAARLKLDDALVQHLHHTIEEAGQTP